MRIIQPVVVAAERWGSRVPFFVEAYAKPYAEIVRKELELAAAQSGDTLLNIGCGAIPFTAIHAVRQRNMNVIAVEADPTTAEDARRCIRSMGLETHIEVVTGRGEYLREVSWNCAIVALQAEPKMQILHTLLEEGQDTSCIIFRLASPAFSDHYDTLDLSGLNYSQVAQDMKTFDRSVLVSCGQHSRMPKATQRRPDSLSVRETGDGVAMIPDQESVLANRRLTRSALVSE